MHRTMDTTQNSNLKKRWNDLLRKKPRLRIRDAATELGVSEMELLATRVGNGCCRLAINWNNFLAELKGLGHVTVLTRNEYCVHERMGHYLNARTVSDEVALVTGKDIDLRISLNHWVHTFAVVSKSEQRTLRSFQVFDAYGDAIHKIFLQSHSNLDCFDKLVIKYRHHNQEPMQSVEKGRPGPAPETFDSKIDGEKFLAGWEGLQDTHDFRDLMNDYHVSRPQAMRLAAGKFTWRASKGSFRKVLQKAAEDNFPIMVFVGNQGCLQIHTGPIKKLAQYGTWYNVLDYEFNLHINEEGIDKAWAVCKPTADGPVHSLEYYDAQGSLIVQFYGKRKPGQPEHEPWTALWESLKKD